MQAQSQIHLLEILEIVCLFKSSSPAKILRERFCTLGQYYNCGDHLDKLTKNK